jgi:glycopeptide antibiotics resistance protein
MHLWGGVLVALGVYILSHFANINFKPTLLTTLAVLLVVMAAWEVFEYLAGLYNPATYVYDTTKDLLFGLCGGLLGYSLLRYFRIGT